MSSSPITQQPQSRSSMSTLMPDEYVRFEYTYKPGCCCFSTKTTTVTNMRLITRVTKPPSICSRQTCVGEEKVKTIFLTDINNIKQLKSAIPSSQNKWWMKCLDIITCQCENEQIDWLESCRAMDTNESIKTISIEKF